MITTRAGYVSSHLATIKADEKEATARYLFYALQAVSACDVAEDASYPTLSLEQVKSITIPVPPIMEQERIVAILDDASEAIATATANAERNLANACELFEKNLAKVFDERGAGWVEEPLGKRVRFIDYRGKTPPKTEVGVRLITAKNVKMGHVQRHPEEFIDATAYDGWMTRGFPKRGDVLFTTEAPLANVAQLDTDERVVIGQRLITMQPEPHSVDRAFLKYMLLSRPLQEAIKAQGTGATVQGIKASLLKQVRIFYPRSLEEQRNIVYELDNLSTARDELEVIGRRKLAALSELKHCIFARAFSGELTTSDPLAA